MSASESNEHILQALAAHITGKSRENSDYWTKYSIHLLFSFTAWILATICKERPEVIDVLIDTWKKGTARSIDGEVKKHQDVLQNIHPATSAIFGQFIKDGEEIRLKSVEMSGGIAEIFRAMAKKMIEEAP